MPTTILAAVSLHLERNQISNRLSARFRVRRKNNAKNRGGRTRRGDDGTGRRLSRSSGPYTGVDELEVREHPRVIFRVDEVTWIDAIVRYLVAPREAGSTKSRLIPKLLVALNA